jgi:hypothetical protein
MRDKPYNKGGTMTSEDRRLIVETLGEMRELKGEMREFKEHVIGRVQALEKKEGEQGKDGDIKLAVRGNPEVV